MRPQGKHSKHNEDLHLYNSTQQDRQMSCWVFFIVNYNLKSLPRTQAFNLTTNSNLLPYHA